MKIDHFQHKNTEIFQIGQEKRELANWLIVQKWPLFEPKMFTVHWCQMVSTLTLLDTLFVTYVRSYLSILF